MRRRVSEGRAQGVAATHDELRPFLNDLAAGEQALVAAALALGAREVPGWSAEEEVLARSARSPAATSASVSLSYPSVPRIPPVEDLRHLLEQGKDPLGEIFCQLRSAAHRRRLGATYTPFEIVEFMVSSLARQDVPRRVVDPGAGSGRFLLRAAREFPEAELVGIEIDPLAALLLRGNLAGMGLAERSHVTVGDYRDAELTATGAIDGPTLYIGNPPYVRHHLVAPEWKRWLVATAHAKGYRSSQLAGLHVYFFLATALRAQQGDRGAFITAAEWLDVNYGRLVRDLFLDRLGGTGVIIIEPTALPFPDAAATAAITSFRIEARPATIPFKRIHALSELRNGQGPGIERERLAAEARWSHLGQARRAIPAGHVELGELFRVHRGQVTGSNRIWIAGKHSRGLPEEVLFPTVTKAREFLQAGLVLADCRPLKRVIDLPPDLSVLGKKEKQAVGRFLALAKAAGADQTYIARNRRAWWSVGLRQPAPILATYMARRPPAFVRNLAQARHINIAHGLYPLQDLSEDYLELLLRFLAARVGISGGRTYAGGLTKFEPREMERITVPAPGAIQESTP
ncbi:MAG TPA: N-6 DNA methylase [Thermoanaerobaculia bacterium]|jgi:predicted RNA methylase|nr:N-6 DNA methylase [Thermoanaerobaculia bacterium]